MGNRTGQVDVTGGGPKLQPYKTNLIVHGLFPGAQSAQKEKTPSHVGKRSNGAGTEKRPNCIGRENKNEEERELYDADKCLDALILSGFAPLSRVFLFFPKLKKVPKLHLLHTKAG